MVQKTNSINPSYSTVGPFNNGYWYVQDYKNQTGFLSLFLNISSINSYNWQGRVVIANRTSVIANRTSDVTYNIQIGHASYLSSGGLITSYYKRMWIYYIILLNP